MHQSNQYLATLEFLPELEGTGIGILYPFRLPICIQCQYCILSTNLHAHIKEHKLATIASFTPAKQDLVIKKYNLSMLDSKPLDGSVALPNLRQVEGSTCTLCPFKSASKDAIRKHPGTHRKDYKPSDLPSDFMRPALLQTFFAPTAKGAGGGYIQVQRSIKPKIKPSDFIQDMLEAQKDAFDPPILDQDDPRTVSPFPHIAEWASWVNRFPPSVLRYLQEQQWSIRPGMVKDCLTLIDRSTALQHFTDSPVRCHLASSKSVYKEKFSLILMKTIERANIPLHPGVVLGCQRTSGVAHLN